MKIIKIGASWCSGCIIMKPRWEEIEKNIKLDTKYYDYDIYEDFLQEKYNIGTKLPVFIFLDKNDQELDRLIGEPSIKEITDKIEKYKEL